MQVLSANGRRRRIKRHLLPFEQGFAAVCQPGLEAFLADELRTIPEILSIDRVERGTVEYRAHLGGMYTSNLLARIPNRILLRLAKFVSPSTTVLYSRSTRIPWELYLDPDIPLRISASSVNSVVNHKRKIADTIEQAIRARLASFGLAFQAVSGAGGAEDGVELLVRLFRNECQISLNTSGQPLYKRNIKRMTALAPLRETLAAGLLAAAAASESDLIMDPFCGSGTLLIEAAMQDLGIPPGGNRTFAFERFPFHQGEKWAAIKRRYANQGRTTPTVQYIGGDISSKAVEATSHNLTSIHVDGFTVTKESAFNHDYHEIAKGYSKPLLISNLPYGVRVGNEDRALRLTRRFIDKVNTDCKGWKVALISPYEKELAALDVNNAKLVRFSNGGTRVVGLIGLM